MSITSALPLPPPPHTLSTTHHRHSTPPPPASHLSLPISPRHSLDEARLSNHKAPTIRTRLSRLCREGQPEVALRVFDTLPQPTTVLWNTIIIGFVCNNMPHEALAFYARMRSTTSTKCDSYTYSSTLKACADTRQLKLGLFV
ncbi:Pentatricopeptide repeat-containing protein At3g22150, chloroplastic [Dionaea muscipula]